MKRAQCAVTLAVAWALACGADLPTPEPTSRATQGLDAVVETWSWIDETLPDGTPSASFYDEDRRELIVTFVINATRSTWAWNGTHWRRAAPGATSFTSPTFTYDAKRREGVAHLGDATTWTWDGSSWTKRSPEHRPPPYYQQALAYVPATERVVLYGTDTTSGTWTWDGADWTQVAGASPSPRLDFAFVRDGNGALLLGGCAASVPLDEAWVFDGASWTLGASPVGLGARCKHMVARTNDGRLALYPGAGDPDSANVWFRSAGGTWTRDAFTLLPAPAQARFAWDPVRDRAMVLTGTTPGTLRVRDAQLGWQETQMPASPNASASIATDTSGDLVMVAGADTWKRLGTWWKATPAGAPAVPDRSLFATAFDETTRTLVLVGGRSGAVDTRDDTWLWDGAAWSAGPAIPVARREHAMASNPGGGVVVFGGFASGSSLDDTWILDGATRGTLAWRRVMPARTPGSRTGAAMAFDARNRRAVLFAGRLASRGSFRATYQDTWSWDGATWTPIDATAKPPHRYGHGMAYNAAENVFVILGGMSSFGDALNDAWTFDGSTWASVTTRFTPPAGARTSLAYDAKTREVVALGAGAVGNAAVSPWSMVRIGGGCAASVDCPGAFCVDGVCCEVERCSTCETCRGLRPGKCTPVTSAEDADTCAIQDKRSCSAESECKTANGAAATVATTCASGVIADGVCCDRACDGACEACVGASKEGGGPDGICGRSTAAARPDGQCAPASCDGDHTLVSLDGTAIEDCGAYRCEGAACKRACVKRTDCAGDADCTAAGACVAFTRAENTESGCALRRPAGGSRDRSRDVGSSLAAIACGLAYFASRRSRRAAASRS